MQLPEPMLAKSGPLPRGPEWRFELKLDGFRAIRLHDGRPSGTEPARLEHDHARARVR